MKRLLIILGFIVLAAGIGYGIYFIFFKPALPPAPPPPEVPKEFIGLPQAFPGVPPIPVAPPEVPPTLPKAAPIARGGPTESPTLVATSTEEAIISADGVNVQYYDRTSGKFFRVTPDGVITPLSDKTFANVQTISWSPDASQAVLEFPDGANVLFDFNTERQATLPKHWEEFSFSPDGEEIISKSIGLDPTNRWLLISDRDGSNPRIIQALGDKADLVKVKWSPNDQIVATSQTGDPAGFGREEILFIGKNGENFRSTIVEGFGFDYIWSKTGDRILYSVSSPDNFYKPRLWVVEAHGERIGSGRRDLGIDTFVDKCSFFDNDTVFCAVPDFLEEGVGFQPVIADTVPDSIWKIDLKTGASTLIGRPDVDTTIERIQISSDGRTLYFVDKATGFLKKMRIAE